MTVTVTPFLRNALLLDAIGSAPIGLALAVASGTFASLFALPQPLLVAVAVCIVVWVAMLAMAARRPAIPASLAWTFVLGNAFWVAASFAILFAGLIQPNALGSAFIIAQALAVALFAWLQWIGVRRQAIPA
jgi:hypothetical protein